MMFQANAPLFGKEDKLAQLLMAQQPNYGEMKDSPLQGLAAALGQIGSAYFGKKKMEADRADTVATLKGALDLGRGSPSGMDANGINWEQSRAPDKSAMAELLMGNPNTAPIAERMILGDMDRQMSLEDKIAEAKALLPFEIEKVKAITGARTAASGGTSMMQNFAFLKQQFPNLDDMTLMRMAANKLGTDITIDESGKAVPMAAEARGATKAEEERMKVIGKARGGKETDLSDRMATLPRLEEVTKELSTLGKTATYTKAGQGLDVARKEMGMEPRKEAVDRTAYISKVDNEVLPLLRQTFGAQFTQKEGESLRATLGDPNKTPAEKDAVLKSFIEAKKGAIRSLQTEVGGWNKDIYKNTAGALGDLMSSDPKNPPSLPSDNGLSPEETNRLMELRKKYGR